MEETSPQVLYETCVHASLPCHPNYPPPQVNDRDNKRLLSLISTRGWSQVKDKLIGYRQPKKLKRWVSLFISPKGELVAVAVGNYITILRKDDDYQHPCGTFTSLNVNAFTAGGWSESHDVLGVVDDVDNLYFIKANGEEIIRIEQRHLKITLPIVGLFVPNDTGKKGAHLCNFNFLTSDGSLHHIEISQDISATISSMRSWVDVKRLLPSKYFCLDYNPKHSFLALVGGTASMTASSGLCSLSLWRWVENSSLQQVSSIQFEGCYSKPKGFTGHSVSPKVQISPFGKFIATLDLRGCLSIFKLDGDHFSLSLVVSGENGNMKKTSCPYPLESYFFGDIVDFIWWSDHVCTIAKKGGSVTMFDATNGKMLVESDLLFSIPVLERPNNLTGKLFVFDIPLLKERMDSADISEISYILDEEQYTEGKISQFEISRLSWRLVSFSERSVSEMYDVLINNQSYASAVDFAHRYKLDKDQVYKSQWLHSEQGAYEVRTLLTNIKDEAFVLGECVERVGCTEDGVRALLAYGLDLTDRYKDFQSQSDKCNVWDFRLSRLQLLQFRDRLETFLGINMGRFSVQEYSKFRVMPINDAAVKLAENGKIGALNLLFKRHPFSLSPSILNILTAVPETIQVPTYSQLLPGRSPPSSNAVRERDWVECDDMVNYIKSLPGNDGRAMLVRTEPIIKQLLGISWPSSYEIVTWYKDRARDIDKFSGQLENSICLLDYGCRKGLYELQQFLHDVSYLQQLVYPEVDDEATLCSISLIEWESLSDYEKFKTMLKDVKEENIVERLQNRAVPFMQSKFNNSGSADEEHQSESTFVVRWLKEIATQSNIEVCTVVIDEWCRDSQSGFFTSEAEAVDCALQCIYSCGATDKWNKMASIISKLPNARGGEICSRGLDKKLKLAEGHIEAGRLLALYQVPKPVSFFLEAHNDDKGVKQILRLILSKFARRQPGRSDNDWASMWRDLQCLQEKAFPFLDLDYMLMEFCRGLLKAGRFSLARNYLKGAGSISLPTEKVEHLVIKTAREYFFSASSLSSPEIWKAKDCLDLLPSSLNVRREADIIDALTVKLPNLGINILPLQYKQVKDPMEVIKMAITNQAGTYMNVDELIEVAKLLGLNSREDICSVQEAIAREAAVAGDLQLAYDLCLALARKGHGLVWDLCAAIARGPAIEGMDVNSRKQLLSFSLCHCDDESIGDLLLAWKGLDVQSQTESLMMLTGTTPSCTGHGTESKYAELSEDEESRISKTKDILSMVSKDIHLANGANWDDVLRENRKVLSFANLQLPWLVELSCKSKFGRDFYPSSVPGKHNVSMRKHAVIVILSWLAMHGFAPRDDLISSLAKAIMEPPVTEEEDVMGCSFLLNLVDAFHGVQVIEEQLRTREDYQETCSIMNVGMIYSLLHNSGTECKDPHQRRELLLSKLQEKISADDLDKVDKAQSTFWRGWKLRLEEQKRTADDTKMLEELIPGVDSERFLSGDFHYMRSVLMSTVESVKSQKKTILKDILKLADTYSFNHVEVLLKFVSSALVSEAWTNEEIAAEISEFKGELLESALEVIKTISCTVYPVINGCDKVRLAYIFSLLSECYLHLEEETDGSEKLSKFYKVLEQECYRVSFIKDLNFKYIVDIDDGSLNFKQFNNEVYKHVNEFSVDALAKMVQMLLCTLTASVSGDLISWKDVYRHHVQTTLKNLQNRATKNLVENPDNLQSWLSDFEQTYDSCRRHIKSLEHSEALFIMQQFFTGIIPSRVFRDRKCDDLIWKDCLIVLLNFWTRLNDDMLEIAESSDEKFGVACLMGCLKVFLRFVVEGNVTPSQGWDTVYYYADHSSFHTTSEYFQFCRAMILSGCGFGSVNPVFSEVLFQSSNQTASPNTKGHFCDVCDFYLNILESVLSNLARDLSDQQNLQNLLFSLSRLEGDLDTLKRVRTSVWGSLARFSDNLELPSHVRVYVLEVMQFILGKNVNISKDQNVAVFPWEDWDEWSCTSKDAEFNAEQIVPSQSDASSSRFKNTLVALKTTEHAASISSHLEITADDLLTIDSAVSCFMKLCEAAETHSHFDALLSILLEWESLFLVEKAKSSAPVEASSDAGNNWSDDWNEGWESFHDEEEPVQKEKVETESSPSIHPLHTCWTEILKKLIQLSRVTEMIKLIDQSLERPDLVLVDEKDARNLCQMLIDSDSFMALKLALLLPYEGIQLWCLDAIEDKLKRGGFLENTEDRDLLTLALSSGIIFTIISKPSFGGTFSYICYLVGNFSRQSQDAHVARMNQSFGDDKDESFYITFRNLLFPSFVTELVRADQHILAGFLVTKFMHTNPSLSLVNIAEAALNRYLEMHLQMLESHISASEIRRKSETLGRTLVSLEVKLKNLIRSALTSLPSSS